jgi:hypothetical protein
MGGKQAKGSAVADSPNHSYISHQKLASESAMAIRRSASVRSSR